MEELHEIVLPRPVDAPAYAPPTEPAPLPGSGDPARRWSAEPEPLVSGPIRSKILRPLFRPLRLAQCMANLVQAHGEPLVAAWILAAAEARVARTSRPGPPRRWLELLGAAFPLPVLQRVNKECCREVLERGLPDAAWASEGLLGELLLSAREPAASRPAGRAGRKSAPCVYTPPELARRIVAATQVGAKRVVDPACGAGVFLLAAFERGFQRRVETGQRPEEAARQVLTHELAGVDVDPQALALARFSLCLAGWECGGLGEELALDLRCADALQALPGLDGKAEVLVGNPPFVEGRGLSSACLADLRARFRCAATGKVNLFAVFVERGLTLLKDGGVLSFILPETFRRNERYRALRELLLEHTIEAIEPLEPNAFGGRVVETVVLRVRKRPPAKGAQVVLRGGMLPQRRMPLGPGLRFGDAMPGALRRQIERMEKIGIPLGACFEVRDGISTGFQPFPLRLLGRVEGHAFIANDGSRWPFDPQKHVRVIDGGEFSACSPVRWEGRWIEYDKTHEHAPPHPGRPFNCQLRERAIFDRAEKLLTRQTARGLIATLDRERFFVRNSVHVTFGKPPGSGADFEEGLSLAALCACLNSTFYEAYVLAVTGETGRVFPQVHIADLKRLPIPARWLTRGGLLCRLGEALLALHAVRRQVPGNGRTPSADEEWNAQSLQLNQQVEQHLKGAFEVVRHTGVD